MADRTRFLIASAAAALCCLVAGVARPALDYAAYHGAAPALLATLQAASLTGLVGGGVAILVAIGAMRRLGLSSGGMRLPGSRTRTILASLIVVALAVGAVVLRSRLEGEAMLWFDMTIHALMLIPAVWSAHLFRRVLRPAA